MFRQSSRMLLASCLTASLCLSACKGGGDNNNQDQRRQTRTTTTQSVNTTAMVSEGLELSMLPELVTQARNGEELEEILNNSGVNNLDLNDDDYVDYLNVEEFRENGQRGFLLFTNEDNERVDVAQVMVDRQQNSSEVIVQGNPAYYGNEARYASSFPLGQVLLAAWLFDMARPRYYHRPYYYGSYPKYYKRTAYIPRSRYRSRLSSGRFKVKGKNYLSRKSKPYKKTTTSFKGSAKTSASSGKSTKKSLANTQGTSFKTTGKKRPAGSGSKSSGFGSSSSRAKKPVRSTTSSSKSGFGSSSSRSRSSSGRSSFGSSSSRSRSSGSRRRSSSSRRRR